MPTIAAIARIVSAHVGVAAVERWAEALHATDMLPGLDEAAGPESAATLLLAVMAALTPDQASAAVARRSVLTAAREPQGDTRKGHKPVLGTANTGNVSRRARAPLRSPRTSGPVVGAER